MEPIRITKKDYLEVRAQRDALSLELEKTRKLLREALDIIRCESEEISSVIKCRREPKSEEC